MQTRRLGRTGHDSTVAILGGVVFHFVEEDQPGEILQDALDRGVNHLDIAPGYGSDEATVGPHIPAVRDRLFISEKSGKTTRDDVRRHLDRTLTRLGIADVDLYQLHGVTDIDDLGRREGAVQALLEARDEGLCRWLGITGHNVTTPVAQLEAVRRYDLDTVMFPIYPRLGADADSRRACGRMRTPAATRRRYSTRQRPEMSVSWSSRPGQPGLGSKAPTDQPRPGTNHNPTHVRSSGASGSCCRRRASPGSVRRATPVCCPGRWTPPSASPRCPTTSAPTRCQPISTTR